METINLGIGDDLPPVDWSIIVERIADGSPPAPDAHNARTTWLTTLNDDGSPHVTAVGALWLDGTFWFQTGAGTKKRPVLVVQNDGDNQRLTNTIVAQISSNTRRAHEPTHLLIEIASEAGKPSGLLSDSVVSCVNLATIHESRIDRTIGSLPPSVMAQIDDCLKAALGLP